MRHEIGAERRGWGRVSGIGAAITALCVGTALSAGSGCAGRDPECAELAIEAAALVATAQTCSDDSECRAVFGTVAEPVCGEPARTFIGEGCAFGVNVTFDEARYESLREQFRALGCVSPEVTGCGDLPPRRCEREEGKSGVCVVDEAPACGEHGSNPLPPDAGDPGPDGGEADAE